MLLLPLPVQGQARREGKASEASSGCGMTLVAPTKCRERGGAWPLSAGQRERRKGESRPPLRSPPPAGSARPSPAGNVPARPSLLHYLPGPWVVKSHGWDGLSDGAGRGEALTRSSNPLPRAQSPPRTRFPAPPLASLYCHDTLPPAPAWLPHPHPRPTRAGWPISGSGTISPV